MSTTSAWKAVAAATLLAVTATACASGTVDEPTGTTDDAEASTNGGDDPVEVAAGKQAVSLWTHSAGNPAEMEKLDAWLEEFNAIQDGHQLVVESFPQGAYNDAVVAAALSDGLPCLLDIDGPNVPNWAYAGYLAPLDLPQETVDAFLPTAVGQWDGQVYAIGQFEAAVALLARASDLDELGLRVPTIDDPWSGEEFQAALDAYMDSGEFEFAFDPGMAWTGEWYPYAFSPLLQSFGGDLVDRDTFLTAEGVLNGDAALAWGEWWSSLFADGYAPGTSQDATNRETGFIDGRYGLQWNGIWAANAAIEELGDDVVFLPAPDWGGGSTIGAGSWQWGISAGCEHADVAQAFIEFILEPERVAAIADAQNVIPGRADARELTEKFSDGGDLAVFYDLSAAQALIRPPSPAYTAMALIFEKAAADIADGADVATALDTAVDEIERDIAANGGYGHT
ncbi:ABC transporter substrate-binding protein [Nitriliruptor alkaliphilus]|uniref:ABC transporter substrate-binding protein n=1 Tax=Nitriliruptor alkaliphilus TaxID=427918 RepID=UPI0009F8F991|nr:extracellular solute-binding protein [Nitriliruptor alkaliphilus]